MRAIARRRRRRAARALRAAARPRERRARRRSTSTARRARVEWPFPSPAAPGSRRSGSAACGAGRVRDRLGAAAARRGARPGRRARRAVLPLRRGDRLGVPRAPARLAPRRGARACGRCTSGAGTSSDAARREAHFHASQERYLRKHYGALGLAAARGRRSGSGAMARAVAAARRARAAPRASGPRSTGSGRSASRAGTALDAGGGRGMTRIVQIVPFIGPGTGVAGVAWNLEQQFRALGATVERYTFDDARRAPPAAVADAPVPASRSRAAGAWCGSARSAPCAPAASSPNAPTPCRSATTTSWPATST